MTDRPASWRMPDAKQMEKMAAALNRKPLPTPALAPNDDPPAEYSQALLKDARSSAMTTKSSIAVLRLAEIPRHLLRAACRRCSRTVEIRKVDAIRLLRPARRLEGCRVAAVGRHLCAEDGTSRGRRLLAVLPCALNAERREWPKHHG